MLDLAQMVIASNTFELSKLGKEKIGMHAASLNSFLDELVKISKDLTTTGRKRIKEGNFALPGRRYPIHDLSHARNALARVAQHGTPEEKAQVQAAVHKKYPGIGDKEKKAGLPSYLKGMLRSGQGLSNVSRGVDAMGNAATKTLMTKNLGQTAGGKLMSHVHGRMAGAAMGANPVGAGNLVRQGQRAAAVSREGMQAASQAPKMLPRPAPMAQPAMKAVG